MKTIAEPGGKPAVQVPNGPRCDDAEEDEMDLGPIDYTSTAPPPGYRCTTCGAHGCKLWRGSNGAPEGLWCCDCAGKSQGLDVSTIDDAGRRMTEDGRTDQIGWRLPAVPDEDGCHFWGYTSVPDAGCVWWRRLPTRTAEAAYQIVAAEALGLVRDVVRQP